MLVILYRHDGQNKTWYYTLDDRQAQLFDRFSLTVRWGTSPEGGRSKHYVFNTLEEKNRMVRSLMNRKLRTHKILYSWFKDKSEDIKSAGAKGKVIAMPGTAPRTSPKTDSSKARRNSRA